MPLLYYSFQNPRSYYCQNGYHVSILTPNYVWSLSKTLWAWISEILFFWNVTFQYKILLYPTRCPRHQFYISSVQGKSKNLKTVVSRKQSTPNFPKNEDFLPLTRTRTRLYFKKTKHAKNEHFLLTDTYTYVCVSRGEKCSFSENLACFVFLKHPFWDSPFCLITDDMIPYCIYFLWF